MRIGAFDDDAALEPRFHTYVGLRPPRDQIADDLPRYDGTRTKDPAQLGRQRRFE